LNFESGLGVWSTPGPPAGSPSGGGDFARSQADVTAAAWTKDSVVLGFGLEQVESAADRGRIMKKIMQSLVGPSGGPHPLP